MEWQTLSANLANKTVDSFEADLHTFISTHFADSAHEDQLEYLHTAIKPYNMTMEALAACLRVIL